MTCHSLIVDHGVLFEKATTRKVIRVLVQHSACVQIRLRCL